MKRLFAFCSPACAHWRCLAARERMMTNRTVDLRDDTTPLTETQIEEFKELFASTADMTDETTGEYRLYDPDAGELLFSPRHYDDPRDIDLAGIFAVLSASAPRWETRTWRNSTLYSTRWE